MGVYLAPQLLLGSSRASNHDICTKMNEIAQVTGHQIAAARKLAGLGQKELARLAIISVATLATMEASDGPAPGIANNVAAVRRALEAAGVEFTNGDEPGVKLKKAAGPESIPDEPKKPPARSRPRI